MIGPGNGSVLHDFTCLLAIGNSLIPWSKHPSLVLALIYAHLHPKELGTNTVIISEPRKDYLSLA